jgi:hypothetical protein
VTAREETYFSLPSSLGTAYGNCPDLSFGLKLERGMKRVLLEEPIFLIR